MARPLAGRVARLEGRRPRVCPACGGGGAGPVVYEVRFPEATATVPTARAARKPAACRSCGRPREVWIALPAARGDA